jgi:hypothetical protein
MSSSIATFDIHTGLGKSTSFPLQIEAEFCTGSAIDPVLYAATTRIVSDTEVSAGGEVSYPIHEALNWHLSRFGHQARTALLAILLLNEDGSTWQAKLSQPRTDAKGKLCKYETPTGNGSRAFLPHIPTEMRDRISQRYNVTVPHDGSFWHWLQHHPDIPIVLTEGGKKALALLSLGYVVIALYGVNGGYRTLFEGSRQLIADLVPFAIVKRQITLAFDQDPKASARRRVTVAIHRFSALLRQAGCDVAIAQWESHQGKGVDDLIVAGGAAAWEQAYLSALTFEDWQHWQRLAHRLTLPAALQVETADLSRLEITTLPERGLIAIASSKGTGKTKFASTLLVGVERVVAGGHRIALMRNLSERLGLDYLGDVDKANGKFIAGSAYTLRLGLCVDSLLAIDPNTFAGCDLVLDEVVQVVRHLLTSSTCAKDGKRPALLARFRLLVQNARRVIVADADLDNATLSYLRDLRGDGEPVFLIRNTYQPQGYPVRFIESPDRTAIVSRLLTAAHDLEAGKVLFVSTDSKGTSKLLARLLLKDCPTLRILLINSETSGGEWEQEFIKIPDPVLLSGEYDIIICSPSVATGVSIEAQGKIAAVYGVFTGASSTDADMAQALGRVREPVERIVWCAKSGSNFSQVSRSTHPIDVRSHLQQKTTATVSLLRCSLREDIVGDFGSYHWDADPHLNLFCRIVADQNRAMLNLRQALLVRLRFEGNRVTIEEHDTHPALKLLLKQTRREQQEIEAEALAAAVDLTYLEVQALEQKERLDPDEILAIAKFYLKDFYALDSLSVEDILWDNEGRRRGELLNLEAQLFPEVAVDRCVKALERQADWNQGFCPWDIPHTELRRRIRTEIGFDELIAKLRAGWRWCKYDLKPYADKARLLRHHIQVALHFTIPETMTDTQIIHQLFSQMGIKLAKFTWSRAVPGHEGEKLRVWTMDCEHWQQMWSVLERRALKRQQLQQQPPAGPSVAGGDGSPLPSAEKQSGGDPTLEADARTLSKAIAYGSERVLRDVWGCWSAELQAVVLQQVWEQSESTIERFAELVPDLFEQAITAEI